MKTDSYGADELVTPREFAQALRVDAKTVIRWAQAGKIRSTRTPGNHVRLFRVELDALLRGQELPGVGQ